ncbi:unnamed protein product [Somion occarium]|uniref:Membrane anchor Opy2 N-terminal domain-containing protein n=1 Tax=Somion occarium TaxID=3059160 RepID=A0ABP1CWX2_9APHY
MVPRNLNALLVARQSDDSDCPPCPDPPPCNCADNEQCIVVNSFNKCIPLASDTKSGGVSAGAVAGAVVSAVVFLVAVILAFLWYRRRSHRRQAAAPAGESKKDAPARAEDVLNRPDPNEKPVTPSPEQQETGTVRVYGGNSITTINLDPEMQGSSAMGTSGHDGVRSSTQSNPFEDNHSIQTTSTGTRSNVIPIALVAPGSVSSGSARSNPVRPSRDPSLNLNLDNNSPQSEASRSGPSYAQSTRSGFTAYRNSYMTTGSYASDLFSEAPVIITPTHGTIKQVLGTAKAEVIRTSPSSVGDGLTPPASAESGRTNFAVNKPPARSPLAASSFGPADVLQESKEEQGQDVSVDNGPFGDEHSPYIVSGSPQPSPAASSNSFAVPEVTPSAYSSQEDWSPNSPRRPWEGGKSRPDSVSTQAQSIIGAEFGSATRVNVGLNHLSANNTVSSRSANSDTLDTPVSAALSTPRTPYRMTSGKLVAPQTGPQAASSPTGGAFELQQRRAMEDLDAAQRMDRSSVVSSASTRADSILEGFPFVPPSPISDRPIRTPPRSPLAQQAFANSNASAGSPPRSPVPTAQPPVQNQAKEDDKAQNVTVRQRAPKKQPNLPPPSMNRKVLGLSTASESSTMSNGLGSFPFQIDSGVSMESSESNSPPSSVSGRQRASLDTLALTSDLSSYPLGFDKNIMNHYPGAKR